VVAVGMYLFYMKLHLAGTFTGLIIAHSLLGAPFVVTTVAAVLKRFNGTLVNASRSLGAGRIETFWRVTLPLILPGVLSGALFAFATSFDEVVVTLFLAGPDQVTIPRQMFSGIRDSITPTIVALATILVLFSTTLLLVMERLRARGAARS
jgi:putative spermidine/putrescine transport system permease protein